MKNKLKFRIFLIVTLALFSQIGFSRLSFALSSPHALELYERGMNFLNSYHGDTADLDEAQQCFMDLVTKFPESPYGYLGLSRIEKISSYLYDNRYNMNKVRDNVLPLAVKALELGPSVKEVHENYSAIENIYEDFYSNQKEAQDALTSFPERPETYLLIGMFFGDQSEGDKAVEFYKMALGMQPGADLRLRILERIGLIYLNELQQPEKALEYFQQAEELEPNSPIFNESLGMTYLSLKNYTKAIEYLSKSINKLKNTYTEGQLAQAKALQAQEEAKTKEAINISMNVSDLSQVK
jgi:tetratricopeptide (TPR) repeat protein